MERTTPRAKASYRPSRRIVLASALMWVLVLGEARDASAHPWHVTSAEAEYNRESGKLEVALRMKPEDLESALRLHTKEDVDLGDDEGLDARIVEYLRERFLVVPRGGKLPPREERIEWVGKEISVKAAWIYFEVPLPGGLQGAVFENRVFLEIAARQINTIRFKDGAFRTTLWFTRDEPKRELNARPDEHSFEQVQPPAVARERERAGSEFLSPRGGQA